MAIFSTVFSIFFLLIPLAKAESSIEAEHVEINLISPQLQVGPESDAKLALHFLLEPSWHIYWKNPGDSGAAPKMRVTGGTVKEIHWPYPKRIPIADLTNYGYENEVALLLDIQTDGSTSKKITFNLEWLVCKVECIPGFGTLSYDVKNGDNELFKAHTDSEFQVYAKYQKLIPFPVTQWNAESVATSSDFFTFRMHPPQGLAVDSVKNIQVFPEDGETFATRDPLISRNKNDFDISVPLQSPFQKKTHSKSMTVVVSRLDNSIEAFELDFRNDTPSSTHSFLIALLFAILGGMILNLMPCVFPVLSLKIFSFLREKNVKHIRSSAWTYTFGVLFTFTAIGIALAVLRYSGESVGWGFQLQNPFIVYLLLLLFFVMALGLIDFILIGGFLSSFFANLGTSKNFRFLSGSFGTGVLTVIVASPCTAPFMGSALGLTLLLPWTQSLLIFVFLGLGMALPMLGVAYLPRLMNHMPKPGFWMEQMKKAMAFPLFATCLWLLWVLSHQTTQDTAYLVLGSLLILTFGFWIIFHIRRTIYSIFAWTMIALIQLFIIDHIQRVRITPFSQTHSSQMPSSVWQNYSQKLVSEAIQNQSVFIDFTATWCITCQVNKRAVLETREIMDKFSQNQVLLIRADWTNYNPEITNALAQFGRNSVPLYVFYDKTFKGSVPKVLPEILTKKTIHDLFEFNPRGAAKGEKQ